MQVAKARYSLKDCFPTVQQIPDCINEIVVERNENAEQEAGNVVDEIEQLLQMQM